MFSVHNVFLVPIISGEVKICLRPKHVSSYGMIKLQSGKDCMQH